MYQIAVCSLQCPPLLLQQQTVHTRQEVVLLQGGAGLRALPWGQGQPASRTQTLVEVLGYSHHKMLNLRSKACIRRLRATDADSCKAGQGVCTETDKAPAQARHSQGTD